MSASLHAGFKKNLLSVHSNIGWRMEGAKGYIVTNRGVSFPSESGAIKLNMWHAWHIKQLASGAVEIWQTLQNTSSQPLQIHKICMFECPIGFEGVGWNIAHSELFKIERYFGGYSVYTNGLFGPIPGTEGEFGLSEDTPFPGMFFTHAERGTLLMSVLTQERCKPCWQIAGKGSLVHLAAKDCFSGIPAIPVPGGATYTTEHWLLLATRASMEDAIDRYFDLLKKRFHFYGGNSVLREEIAWGSWNYNIRPEGHGDITHDYIIANARALKKHCKKVRWVMIDSGYQRFKPGCRGDKELFRGSFKGIEIFDPSLASPHDPARFPQGMAYTAEAIRKTGLKPAIWSTPLVDSASPLLRRNPDWLLRLEGNRHFIPGQAWLDYSIPEVRAYTRGAWDTIFNKWKYSGLKLDFWTYPFEIPFVRFHNKDKTALELRNLFLEDLRAFVPKEGYLLVACTVNAGNPFLGLHADASRLGTDIGSGRWSDVQRSALWINMAGLFYRGDCLLADPDSIGWCPGLKEDENQTWATAALMCGGMCEIGGNMTKLSPQAGKIIKTSLDFFRPAQRSRNTFCRLNIKGVPSDHLVLERPDGCYEAFVNWQEYPMQPHLARPVKDIWSGKRIHGDNLLKPHTSWMFRR